MYKKSSLFIEFYIRGFLAFLVSFCLVRGYEYFLIAYKSFVKKAILFELLGLIYDVGTCFLYGLLLFVPLWLLFLLYSSAGKVITHTLNLLIICIYLCLIMVFAERNMPFDHEILTRSFQESWITSKQMMTSGITFFLPFIFYISIYFVAYQFAFRHFTISRIIIKFFLGISIASLLLIKFIMPNENNFEEKKAFYFTCNKLTFWCNDIIEYLINKDKFDASHYSTEALNEAIQFYQKNQAFTFTQSTYPLLHLNNSNDVLGSFFNLDATTPPNIVIIVVEGLSRDFSGDNAYAGSFTPFLDALSKKSLTWNNFLSTAPGTFAAQPAITGSLPYGARGFSLLNVMPDHLSLIKILRANGYHSKFFIGFNPDFDNMGGYMRLQGTDMILTKYGSKYKMMGVGSEGWSMGYPDDALYNRSFEVMDSIKKTPYLHIYHTGTTHMPYLFAQQNEYGKLFDKKMAALPDTLKIKKTLKETKQVLITYMFSDDCLKNFFSKYEKRLEYKNTIFFITGDHHIGSFPSTSGIDDYHIPFIVFSPMLKSPKKFLSINSHNNIAPTISTLVLKNYPSLPYTPQAVSWLADVIDTSASFRNQQSMPFMEWSRAMTDYIYKNYYLSGQQLYAIQPNLSIIKTRNDTVKNHMSQLLDNFKLINNLVCTQNLLYPKNLLKEEGQRQVLLNYFNPALQIFSTKKSDSTIIPDIPISKSFHFLSVEVTADIKFLSPGLEDQPSFRLSLIDTIGNKRDFLFWTNHNIVQMTKGDFIEKQWNTTSTSDMFTIGDFKKSKSLLFNLSFFSYAQPMNLQMKNLRIKITGIK